MIGGDQNIGEIGRGQLTHQLDQILNRSLGRYRNIFFGGELVTRCINLIMIKIENVMIPKEILALG